MSPCYEAATVAAIDSDVFSTLLCFVGREVVEDVGVALWYVTAYHLARLN